MVHILGDYHERMRLGHDTLQTDHVLVLELGHNARLGQKVAAILVRRAELERLDRHCRPFALSALQRAFANVTEFTFIGENAKYYIIIIKRSSSRVNDAYLLRSPTQF